MTRTLHRLSDTRARSPHLKAGRHADGGGLYLNVKESGSKSWIFLYSSEEGRRAMGLGSYPELSLAAARERAANLRSAVAEGRSPRLEGRAQVEPTFSDCVDLFLASMEGQWRNEKHKAQWRSTLSDSYCGALLGLRVSSVRTEDVLKVLTPIWATKSETASRIRGRIERVLDYAKARGWRTGENPALWRGHLKSILPPRKKLSRGHHAALPYTELPLFLSALRTREAMAARALEFLILTAARSGEVLGATWNEIDLKERVWTVPASRMKAARQHRVPLSSAALGVIKPLLETSNSNFVFPGHRAGRALSGMSMEMQLRRMKANHITVHGFRSTFRDWAGEETSYPREIAEAALAHVVGDATERAYRRSDAIEKRRRLMEDWAGFCAANEPQPFDAHEPE